MNIRDYHSPRELLAYVCKDVSFSRAEAAAIAEFVKSHWENSTEEGARILVEIMENVPSTGWSYMIGDASRHAIRHWQLVLEHSSRLYERAADAWADEDGLTYAP